MSVLLRKLKFLWLVAALVATGAAAQDAKTELMWLGQSAFRVTPPGAHFTMDPADAAEFLKAMDGSATKVIVPKPGKAVRF